MPENTPAATDELTITVKEAIPQPRQYRDRVYTLAELREIWPKGQEEIVSKLLDEIERLRALSAAPITDEQVAELDRLHEAATPGPWSFNAHSTVFSAPMCKAYEAITEDGKTELAYIAELEAAEPEVCSVPPHHGDTAIGRHYADGELIARLRNAYPALRAHIESLTTRLAEAESKREQYRKTLDEIGGLEGMPRYVTDLAAIANAEDKPDVHSAAGA